MDQEKVQKWDQKASLQDMSINEQNHNLISDKNNQLRRYSKRNAGIQQPSGQSQIYESFDLQNKKQSKTDIIFIVMCLKMHFVFSSLNDAQLNHLAQQMFYCKLPNGQTILKQGDSASSFFIIEKGRIQVSINKVPKKELLTGNGFGELALLYNAPRSATCTALEDCYLWGIDRHTFRTTIEQIMRSEYEKNRKHLENVKFFNQLTPQQKDAIAGILISQKFIKDQIIVNEGDMASSFYIIAEGKVGIFKDGTLIRELEQNESFGEQALIATNAVRAMTVKAIDGDAKVLALGRDLISKILGDQVEYIIYKNQCKWIIQKSKYQMPLNQLDKFLDCLTIRRLHAGQKIINKGDKFGSLVILIDVAAVDEQGTSYNSGTILNEDSLQKEGIHDRDYMLKDDGHIAFMDYIIFTQQFGKHQQILQTHTQQKTSETTKIKDKPLSELLFLAKLGAGQFGQVYLCKYKDVDTLFALKFITRAHIKQFGISKHIHLERQVLAMVDHPFIMRFYRSFKDAENVYLLTEYIPGEELFDAIRVIGLLSKYDSQFYVSQMILQMEYLHSVHSVIYRDIKPENLMVDEQGYLKLIDMGTSKPCPPGHKAFTIIGTPHYMAPEVISGKGYNQMADLWGVGVCLYEFICGGLPFGENAEDPFEIYKEIVKKSISYPSYMADKSAKVIIEQLLSKVPEMRLGGSYTNLKQNEWFKDFNWDNLMNRKLKAPTIPKKGFTSVQIQIMERKGQKVTDQVLKDTKDVKKVLATAKDEDWDSIF